MKTRSCHRFRTKPTGASLGTDLRVAIDNPTQEVEIFSLRKLLSFCYALRESVPWNDNLDRMKWVRTVSLGFQ
jgi:hypothetical protein